MTTEFSLKEVKKTALKIPVYQLIIGAIMAVVFYATMGQLAGISAISGATISALGSWVFALFLVMPQREGQSLVGRMMAGEVTKFLVIGLLFYLAITLFTFQLMPLLIGFVATLLAFWVALLTSFK